MDSKSSPEAVSSNDMVQSFTQVIPGMKQEVK